jgi:hypothetical protein
MCSDRRCYPGALQFVETLRANRIPVLFETLPDYTFGYLPDFAARLAAALEFITAV